MRFDRARDDDTSSHERWVLSYADFITLLFAFFVVMYAISSVNEGKYQVMTDSFSEAFNATPSSMRPIEVGPYLGFGGFDPNSVIDIPFPAPAELSDQTSENEAPGVLTGGTEVLNQIAGEIRNSFPELFEQELIHLGETENWLEIEINNSLLFASGEAIPNGKALEIITGLAKPLMQSDYPVNVEGFTDNVPISNERFPSNWELSAARAAAIVRILEQSGMSSTRLAAIGYGQHKPIASNEYEPGRQRNRRVVLVMTKPTNRFEQTDGGLKAKPGSPDGPVQAYRLAGGGLLFTDKPPAGAVPVNADDNQPKTPAQSLPKPIVIPMQLPNG